MLLDIFIRVMYKILLDTDIGNNIDDALCLAYLLAHPECELLGITTVSGEAEIRAKIASAICQQSGFPNIPVLPGADKPLILPQKQPRAIQAAVLSKWRFDKHFPKNQAIDFLRHTIRDHPHEIHLLTIGSLTNIAILFKLDEEIPTLLASHHLMCGKFTKRRIKGWGEVERNAAYDPHACQIVFQTMVNNQKVFGLDVTTQLIMDADVFKQQFKHPHFQPVLELSEIWFKERSFVAFHDPLAAAAIFNPDLCRYQRGNVIVDLCHPTLYGATRLEEQENGRTQVAVDVNPQAFFRDFCF